MTSTLSSQLRCSESLADFIGKTPLLRLQSFESPDGAAIWGKLESANPGGSVKDRIALSMIRAAEKDGHLHPGATLVEPTSGNTGIGLAWVCAQLGYKLILCMPESMSMERRQLLQAHGARLELTPKSEGMSGAIARAEQLQAETGAFMPQQFNNPANPAVHAATTGPEIYTALEGKVDAFVTGVGTGGTITGWGFICAPATRKFISQRWSRRRARSSPAALLHLMPSRGSGPDLSPQCWSRVCSMQ